MPNGLNQNDNLRSASPDLSALVQRPLTLQDILHPQGTGFRLASPYEARVFISGTDTYSLRELDQVMLASRDSSWENVRQRFVEGLNSECLNIAYSAGQFVASTYQLGRVESDLQGIRAKCQALAELRKSAEDPAIVMGSEYIPKMSQIVSEIITHADDILNRLDILLLPRTREKVELLLAAKSSPYIYPGNISWNEADPTLRIDPAATLLIKGGVENGLGLIQIPGVGSTGFTLSFMRRLLQEYAEDRAWHSEALGNELRAQQKRIEIEATDAAYVWAQDHQQEIVDLVEVSGRTALRGGPSVFNDYKASIESRLSLTDPRGLASELLINGEPSIDAARARAQIDHDISTAALRMLESLEVESIHSGSEQQARELSAQIHLCFRLPTTEENVLGGASDEIATITPRLVLMQRIERGQLQVLRQSLAEYGIEIHATSDPHAAQWIGSMVPVLVPHELSHLLIDEFASAVASVKDELHRKYTEPLRESRIEAKDQEFIIECAKEAMIDGLGSQLLAESVPERSAALTSLMTFITSRYDPHMKGTEFSFIQRLAVALRVCAQADETLESNPNLGPTAKDFEGRPLDQARVDLQELCQDLAGRCGISDELLSGLLESYRRAFRVGAALDLDPFRIA